MFKNNKDIPEICIAKFVDENGYLDSEFLRRFKKLPSYGKYIITSQEHRTDVYANDIWGEPTWGFLLPIYNFKTIYEMQFGTELVYPSADSIRELITSL